jgi:hypothetical protein
MAVQIWVDEKFAEMLNEGQTRLNITIERKFRKKINFIDFTELLADLLKNDFDLILTRGFFIPIKKGRKAKTIELNFEPIPV